MNTFHGLCPKVTFTFLNIFLRRCVGAWEWVFIEYSHTWKIVPAVAEQIKPY